MILSVAIGKLNTGWKCRPGVLMCVEQATVFQGSRSDLTAVFDPWMSFYEINDKPIAKKSRGFTRSSLMNGFSFSFET